MKGGAAQTVSAISPGPSATADKWSVDHQAWPQSWYPLVLSRSVGRSDATAATIFGRQLVIFRGDSGAVCVAPRHCCHMGADLSRGRVRGDCLHCPLHGWSFDHSGRCVHIPSSNAIPPGARLQVLPSHEAYGVVFVFVGEQAWPFAQFPAAEVRASQARRLRVPVPHGAISLNAFDGQHFEHVHHRRLHAGASINQNHRHHLGIRFTADVIGSRLQSRLMRVIGSRQVDIEIDCWGGNHLYMRNHHVGLGAMVSMQPLNETETLIFVAAVAEHRAGLVGLWQGLVLAISARMTRAFLAPDVTALNGIKLRPGCLLPEIDDGARRFFRYWRALPRVGAGR